MYPTSPWLQGDDGWNIDGEREEGDESIFFSSLYQKIESTYSPVHVVCLSHKLAITLMLLSKLTF